ncbi:MULTISPECIES: folate family ECF transporter S component [Pseudobutyrivibrio]|jgi:ECF transporter S component (folate family)|uniref:ECF transporter S component, folate family n=1 Tax=Pseudobutyrivibrio ruminis DSM 9787 TaxID=1123011 RepID=A0A285RVQ3_9FIRM|nr:MULTISPECIES: folate family ECF transporter S component [Pseudobutyrivibrio]SFO54518.1 ECF transporter S component, folate family [Pseudobutyrivibrio sp. JW11]SOB98247.1 ECF transporter S component, folate family [Pseudobutyrivibrio ruminis DSM 9787]
MKKLTNTKTLTAAAMLSALGIVLGFFKIPINQLIEIRFGALPIEMAGQLFGPAVAGVVGGITDIGGYLVKPTGPFFPGFTFSSIVGGIIFGLMLHNKKITFARVLATQVVYTIVVGIILNSYWLDVLYFQNGYFATIMARLPKELIMIPIMSVIYYSIVKAFGRTRIGEFAR